MIVFVAPAATRAWLLTSGLRILFVIAAFFIARVILRHAIPLGIRHSLVRAVDQEERSEQIKRADTLSGVILATSLAAVLIAAIFLILGDLGFSIAPVVAGLGISGIAIGLGAQTLVKDAINGIFILAENQFRVGDIVTVAGAKGQVEEIGLRRTILRAEDGTVFTVPNSSIAVAANHTHGYSGIAFNVALSFAADLDRTIQEINRIGQELAADPELGHFVLSPPTALRVDSLEDTYLNVLVSGRAAPVPGAQAVIAGEMRRRIKQEFDRLGILYRGSPTPPDRATD
jgi:small conductance mechanosensitive channel